MLSAAFPGGLATSRAVNSCAHIGFPFFVITRRINSSLTAKQLCEETLLRSLGRFYLTSRVLPVAPIRSRDTALHVLDVLTAPSPGSFPAHFTFHWTAHNFSPTSFRLKSSYPRGYINTIPPRVYPRSSLTMPERLRNQPRTRTDGLRLGSICR